MSNPALTEQAFAKARDEEMQAGWAASPHAPTAPPGGHGQPTGPAQGGFPAAQAWPGQAPPQQWPGQTGGVPPRLPQAPDEVSAWPPAPSGYKAMRTAGVASATGVLLAILVFTGFFGYQSVTETIVETVRGPQVQTTMPGWLLPLLFVGLGIAILTIFKPKLARFTAVAYAAVQGLVVGAISHLYEAQYDGIVLQAVGLTVGVFIVMLGLFSFRIIKVTEKLRMGIIAATGAIMLVYLATFVVGLFGGNVPYIHDAGPVGIGFSLLVVGIAAFNLLLDFDLVERGVAAQAPRYMEWYAAFGLLVTLVWLYLELLRLLSKLRER